MPSVPYFHRYTVLQQIFWEIISLIYSPCPFCSGVLYRDAGNISMAVTAYEQCLKIDPDSRNAGQVPLHESYMV